MNRQTGFISLAVIVLLSLGIITSGYFLYDGYNQQESLSAKLTSTTKKLRRTEKNLREKESSLSQQESKLFGLNNQRSRLKEEIDDIKIQLEQSLKSKQETEKHLAKASSDLKESLSEKEKQYGKLTKSFNEKEDAYEKELAQLNKFSSTLNQKYQSSQEELHNERSRIESLVADVNKRQSELAQAKETLANEQAQSHTYTSTIEALENNISKQQKELSQAQEQLDIERSLTQSYSSKIETLEERLAREQKALSDLRNTLNIMDKSNKNLSSNGTKKGAEKFRLIKQFNDGLTIIRLEDSILFPIGSAELNEIGKRTLSIVADTLEEFPHHRISIEGHTDRNPITSDLNKKYPSNWELSSARAAGAIRYLTRQGLASKQFQAVGFGSTRPIAKSTSEEEQQKNRRIEILLYPPIETLTIEVLKSSLSNKLSSN